MWKLKGCPRCKGDLETRVTINGPEDHCLQCGYIGYLDITTDRVQSTRNGGKYGGYHRPMRLPGYRDNCGRRF